MLSFVSTQEAAGLLRAIAPNCREPNLWGGHLAVAMHRFGISNDLNFVAAFIAQVLVESSELTQLVENLSYSAPRLRAVWPARFPSLDIAARYAHRPADLANFVYSDRIGNGPPASGDGWRFRGRGPVQVTGRANYVRLGSVLQLPLTEQPALLEEPSVGARAAAWFWWERQLSFLAADLPDDDDESDFVTITRKINGGVHGLERRRAYWIAGLNYLKRAA